MAEEETNKEKKPKKQHKSLTVFLTTFIVTFAFVALATKYFSPEYDVEIGRNGEESEAEDSEKGSVDERLRWIQFEDNMPGVSTRFTSAEEAAQEEEQQKEEAIVYDEETAQNEIKKETAKAEPVIKVEKTESQQPSAPAITDAPAVPKMSKIYVGQFATIEQAIAMQNKLNDAGLNLSPFVKKVGSFYVVQVGSYASSQTAQNVAAEVQNAGYSAKIVNE